MPAPAYGTLIPISPNDTVDLPQVISGLYVGGAGVAVVLPVGGATPVTLIGLLAGTVYPFQLRRVLSTGTSATSLIGLA